MKSVKSRQKPLLEAFFEWLHTLEDSVDRSSLIGEAVLYTLNQEVYLKDIWRTDTYASIIWRRNVH